MIIICEMKRTVFVINWDTMPTNAKPIMIMTSGCNLRFIGSPPVNRKTTESLPSIVNEYYFYNYSKISCIFCYSTNVT